MAAKHAVSGFRLTARLFRAPVYENQPIKLIVDNKQTRNAASWLAKKQHFNIAVRMQAFRICTTKNNFNPHAIGRLIGATQKKNPGPVRLLFMAAFFLPRTRVSYRLRQVVCA